MNNADTRDICGLAVTGVEMVDCACHNMKWPNSIGDLQLGEKYNVIFVKVYLACTRIRY